jgi:uncharacterized protein (TIGR00730 family)
MRSRADVTSFGAMKRICVFCGSSLGSRPEFADAAVALGQELARRGLELVYGGASVGLMGLVADAVLRGGGRAIGVIPEPLASKELAHAGLSELHVVGSMHERKAKMAELADGFVTLPGGIGTFEETFEILTWAQLGLHRKPCGLLDVAGYYAPVVQLLDHANKEGFVRREHLSMVLVESTPTALLDRFATYEPQFVAKWIERSQT